MRHYSYIATSLLLLLTVALPLTADALHSSQKPTIGDLANDPNYMTLVREREVLQGRSDSISSTIAETRHRFVSMIERGRSDSTLIINHDSFSRQILSLEQQVFALRTQIGALSNSINNMEREWVMRHFEQGFAEEIEEEVKTDAMQADSIATNDIDIVETEPTYANLIDNRCFRELLSEADYAELRRAHNEEIEMAELGNDYCAIYGKMRGAAEEYMAATDEVVADSILTSYYDLRQRADSLNNVIHSQWNHILDAKYYAYGYIMEVQHNYDLLDSSAEEFNTMQQQCSANDGIYDSDALMHYVVGHPTLTEYEIEIAEALGLSQSRDSIITARDNMAAIEYRHLPITVERRLFLDYSPITIGRTNHYNDKNPVPEVKVYERGTIYRILLGTFRSKQPMTLFKGVQPLYIAKNDEGKYCYYAGGFATRAEADEAQLFLRDKGFKAPEICVWIDGEMTNISAASDDDIGIQTPITGMRYTINIETEQLDESLRELIDSIAAGKSLSRANGKFIIGTFTSSSEADVIVSVLSESYPELNISIGEIELK